MAILNLTPHIILSQTMTEGYENEKGDWIEGQPSWKPVCQCDVVFEGQAKETKFEDGKVRLYSHVVYLPTTCRDFAIGERIRLALFTEKLSESFDASELPEYSVQGFHRYQHQCKIWAYGVQG